MTDIIPLDALVIGAGPAGLMAAQALATAGRRVVMCEANPSVGRKFLMAGKSGLNLTKAEPQAAFTAQYHEAADWLAPMLAGFGPEAVQDWARGLGQPVFTGTSQRVFPTAMKASPLLRAWLVRLAGLQVEIRPRWRWQGFAPQGLAFQTPQGPATLAPKTTVLALGGASWARLGSDAAWVPWLAEIGVDIAPARPANMGFAVTWSPHMAKHFGSPVKGTALRAGALHSRGEFVISARGLEGGGIYAVSRTMRDGAPLFLDLLPGVSPAEIAARLAPRSKDSVPNILRKALHLDAARIALLMEYGRPLPTDPEALAARIKALLVTHAGPRPIDEAISTAGGIRRAALTDGLELRARPGLFACGEMLDWEAPTGGYLITVCLATGLWAGQNAASSGGTDEKPLGELPGKPAETPVKFV